MAKAKDLTNNQFGRLKVIERVENDNQGKAMWLCQCECGNYTKVRGYDLRKNHIKSCGCWQRKTHGFNKTRLHITWGLMKDRCNNKNNMNFHNYGGRGIKVCREWNEKFICFYDWAMNSGYKDNLTIDRIDNDGNYEPTNCRWVTMKEQGNNKRNNVIVDTELGNKNLKQLSEITGIKYPTIVARYNKGFNSQELISKTDGRKTRMNKPVIQFDINGNKICEFSSVREAGKETNSYHSNISACCRGKIKTYKGYIWKYKE